MNIKIHLILISLVLMSSLAFAGKTTKWTDGEGTKHTVSSNNSATNYSTVDKDGNYRDYGDQGLNIKDHDDIVKDAKNPKN